MTSPGYLAEALIRAAPAIVARGADARRERPLRAGRARLLRGDVPDPAHEVGVARRAEADVVREHGCPEQVAVAVHGVDAVDQGDAEPRLERGRLEAVDHVRPGFRRVLGRGRTA